MSDIQQHLISLIAQHAEVDSTGLNSETLIKDSGIDSIGIAELLFDLEEAYDISIDLGGDIQSRLEFGTIGDMAILLENASVENPRATSSNVV